VVAGVAGEAVVEAEGQVGRVPAVPAHAAHEEGPARAARPLVGDPLPQVAGHVVKAEGVGREAADGGRVLEAVLRDLVVGEVVGRREGRLAARVFHMFETGRELREIVEELEIPPRLVRDLWHEWLVDLEEGEMNRRKNSQEERRRRAEEAQLRELERRNEQEQKTFETIMTGMTAAGPGAGK